MTLYDFIDMVVDGTDIKLYDFGVNSYVYEGPSFDIPEKYNDRIVASVEVDGKYLCINLEQED